MKKKIIFSSVATIIICLCLAVGATYALFTDVANVNISATSGKLDITATVDQASLEKYSLNVDRTNEATFTNGGTADFNAEGALVLDKVTPGDGVKFNINVDNSETNIAIQYKVIMVVEYDTNGTAEELDARKAMAAALVAKATVNGTEYTITGTANETDYILVPQGMDIGDIPVNVELPKETGNEAQNATVTVKFVIEAVQGNGVETESETVSETETETETETA